jgi:hypothetical protein
MPMPLAPPRSPRSAAIAAMLLAAGMACGDPATAAPLKAAVFPFEFIELGNDFGISQPPEAEKARLQLAGHVLRDRLAASGAYAPVELAAQNAAIEKAPPLRSCQSCAETIARGANAEIAVVGYVQKVSNLILNITITVSNAETGQVVAFGTADIRGNTDESWTRGVEWLVKNRLLAKKQQ